jgi:hypothetical protein
MESESKRTVNHDEIRRWAEGYAGKPEVFDNPRAGADHVGLRIDFPGHADDAFVPEGNPPREISWDEFFELFDRLGLAFVYRDDPHAEDKSDLYLFEPRQGFARVLHET